MTDTEQRFALSYGEVDSDYPGLVREQDGTVWVVLPDGTRTRLGGSNFFSRSAILFTETEGDGTYTGTITVPPGTSVLDCACFALAGPWNCSQGHLAVGDDIQGENAYIPTTTSLTTNLTTPYDNVTPGLQAKWLNPNLAGGDYQHAANWYAAGNAVYTPTVRYPNGATVTATVVTQYGGSIVTQQVDPDNRGSGYAVGNTGTIHSSFGGVDAHYVVASVGGGGSVQTITLSGPGTKFQAGDIQNTTVTTGGGDGLLAVDVLSVDIPPITDPGVLVVDLIGFGVPPGFQNAVKTEDS